MRASLLGYNFLIRYKTFRIIKDAQVNQKKLLVAKN